MSKGKENVSKGKEPIASTSSETGSVSNPKHTANPSASFYSEVIGILKELHQNQTKVNERLETLLSRVDAIYNDSYSYDKLGQYDESEFDYGQYPEYDDACENRDLDHRPSNCNAFVKTAVNQPLWRFLKPQTQTDDVKMHGIQNNVIRAPPD